MIGWIICKFKGHLDGEPAFKLPPLDETNREINSRLMIYACPRCGGHYVQSPAASRDGQQEDK